MKITISQIRKAIEHDNNMVANHKGAIYFLGMENRKERIKQNLASNLFYEECKKSGAYGCFEIYRLLLEKKIPKDIVEFYVKTKNGGYTELQIIALQYGIKRDNFVVLESIQSVFEQVLGVYKDSYKEIKKCFKGFVEIV
jgi:hypothetical protein